MPHPLPGHPFRRFGQVIPVGSEGAGLTLFIDRRLGGEIGWFGRLDAAPEAVSGLLDRARTELRARGVRRMIGPVDGTIWHANRIQTAGPRTPRLAVEPAYPEALVRPLVDAGLRPVRSFVCYRYPTFALDAEAAEGAAARAHRAGYRVRALRPDDLAVEMEHLRVLANDAFVDSLGFVPLSRAEFLDLYRPLSQLVDPAMVALAEDPAGEPCGFLLAFPDPTEVVAAARGPLGWLRAPLALRRSRGVIYKTLAVHPDHQGQGLAKAMSAPVLTAAAARAAGRGALFLGYFDEGNEPSIRAAHALLDVGEPEIRRYALLGMDL